MTIQQLIEELEKHAKLVGRDAPVSTELMGRDRCPRCDRFLEVTLNGKVYGAATQNGLVLILAEERNLNE